MSANTLPQLHIHAPAKLNLYLSIGGKKPDGFHALESLFIALDFHDTLIFEKLPGQQDIAAPEIQMEYDPPALFPFPVPPEENLVTKAVLLFRERTGFREGLKITVKKRIPAGSGLGGGSSDAAAALLALNSLASGSSHRDLLDNTALGELGASLGSDIPFFLSGACAARVSGRGERIQPVKLPPAFSPLYFLLVNPGFSVSTAYAYQMLDSMRQERGVEIVSAGSSWSLHQINRFLAESPGKWPFENDFLANNSFGETGFIYQHILLNLKKLGADFSGLSGSGSTCFGVFSDKEKAENARILLSKEQAFVIVTFPLALGSIPYYNSNSVVRKLPVSE